MGRAIKRALALLIALLLALPTCALADDAAEDFAAYEDPAFAEDTDALFESVDAEVGEIEWDLPGAEDVDWADAKSDEPTDGDIAPDDAATVELEPEDVVSEDLGTGDTTLDPGPAPEGTDESDPDDTEESPLDDADETISDVTDESAPEVASDPEAEGGASNEATYLDEDAADEADPGVADESAPDAGDESAPETAEDADADAEVEADEADFVELVDEIVPEAVEFNQSEMVNGVVVSVSALPGVFPEGAALSVKRVPTYKQHQAGQAIDEVRDEDQNVAASYTFDIKVIDPETREEYQPGEGNAVAVSFTLSEAADANLETNVYHVTGEADSLTAEKLEADVDAGTETVTAESDGFSLYTVEFTYNSIEYVMQGGTSVALSDVLSFVGLSGEAETVAVSDERLFSASDATGEWIITSHQAFTTPEWMKVTINGKVFEIAVKDATGSVVYLDDHGEQKTQGDVTILTTSDAVMQTGWYVVQDTVTIASRIEVSGVVHLILADGAALIAPYGIHVGAGNALTIYGQTQNTGNLYINYDTDTHSFNPVSDEGQGCAGIGGNVNESAGSITINGGNLKVKGFSSGAGIGGGRYGSDGGNITINGGKVLAVSGGYAAGIGGGEGESDTTKGSGGYITINGGTVEATGAGGGAGIGPGHIASGQNSGGTIVINGGSVTATGGNSGKAIGASNSSTAADLSLYSNAKVTAGASSGAAEAKLTSDRLNACSGNIYARIEPCTEHEYIYQTDETNHRPVCKFCATEGTEESHNLQNGTCTVCGYKPFYNIEISTFAHGSVAASIEGTAVTQAQAGDKVTLTVSVAENYILDSLSVVTNDPNIKGVYFYNDKEGQQTFEFTMPGHAVEVKPAIVTKWQWLQNNISRIENASDENTLVLPFDVTAMAEDDEPLTINTERSFTLNLDNHTVDRGLSAARTDGSVFVVTGNITNSRVAIKNGTVKGGFTQSYGGGINANYGGELTLQGVALQGNRAAAGGGIYISGADAVIDGCTIDDNVLEKASNITARGGGVFADYCKSIAFKGCTIQKNRANYGAGIAILNSNVTFEKSGETRCTITGNEAMDNGGGGGIYYEAMLGASGRFTGSMAYVDIRNNKAGYGAGIVIQSNNNADVTLELDYASVTDNIATGNGGGIWMEGPKTRLKLIQTNVNKNKASCGGGACVANGAELDIDSWANSINENQAHQGGGLYINGATVVSRYSLNNNTADADGGGAYVTANTDYDTLLSMNDSNSMCKGNKAGGNGGGIYVKGLENSTRTTRVSITSENAQRGIRENRADGYGGGVYITGPKEKVIFSISSVKRVEGNYAGADGGGIYADGGTVKLNDRSQVTGNYSVGGAGGIYVANNAALELTDTPKVQSNQGNCTLSGKLSQEGTLTGGKTGNVYLASSGKTIAVKGDLTGADIGVTTKWTPNATDGVVTITSGLKQQGNVGTDAFSSDRTDYKVGWNDAEDEAVLGLPMAQSVEDYTGTYDGEAHNLQVSVTAPAEGYTVLYSQDGETYAEDLDIRSAGTHTVYYKVTAKGYAPESGSGKVEIKKKALTVTADAKRKTQGEADPALTYTADGLVAGDSLSGALSRSPGEGAGSYAINRGTLTAGDNYDMTFVGAKLTIAAKPAAPTKPSTPNPAPAPAPAPAPITGGSSPDETLLALMKHSGKTAMTLSWTAVAGAEGYDVFFAKCGEPLALNQTVGGLACRIDGLARKTAYQARVYAWNTAGGVKSYIGKASPDVYAVTGGSNKKWTYAKKVTARKSKLLLAVGRRGRIKAKVKAVKSGKKLLKYVGKLRYYSSDRNVAVVDARGNVTAVGAGVCTIHVLGNNGVRRDIAVTVVSQPTKVRFKKKAYKVKTGRTLGLFNKLKLTPAGVTGSFTWTSSNPAVAVVDGNGVVTGVKKGRATITATCVNGLSARVKVNVK